MGKFFGKVGYAVMSETSPGVWEESITEHDYYGDVTRASRNLVAGDHLNDDLTVDNMISIVADGFAYENFFAIRYVNWMGASWKVTSAEVMRPRIILKIGGVYNGNTA